ncbi:MAG TPA: DUF1259 domain-containing protein [Terriglobales bacterium]|nr:DUF1259 domain-containing protein [Terriglobales bacterium]
MKALSVVLALTLFSATLCSAAAATQEITPQEQKSLEQILGRAGERQPDGAVKFGFPRSDLHVTVRGTPIAAGLALGGWIAFFPAQGNTMAMGDLVLTEEELPKVLAKLSGSPVEVTAVHNHLVGESPRVMYAHVAGKGEAGALARAFAAALHETAIPAPGAASTATLAVEQKAIESCMGRAGKVKGAVLSFSAPPPAPVTEDGAAIPNSAGVSTAINMQFPAAGRALATGDFVLRGEQVQPVAAALLSGGIQVTALHSHMLHESPRLFFMHFWADGAPESVCGTLHKALSAAGH